MTEPARVSLMRVLWGQVELDVVEFDLEEVDGDERDGEGDIDKLGLTTLD